MKTERGKFRYTHEGILYTSVKSLAIALGFKLSTFQRYLLKSDSIEEAISSCRNGGNRGITFNGKHYNSLNDLADAYGVGRDTLKSRINLKKMSLEEAINTPVRHVNIVGTIEFMGKNYNGISNLAKAYGMSDNCLRGRLNRGMSLEDALLTPVKDSGKGKPVSLGDRDYKSISELARDYGIEPSTLLGRLRTGVAEENLLKPVGTFYTSPNTVTYNGVEYDSYKALAEAYNVDYGLLLARVGMGWLLETALTKPSYKIFIEYNGKEYHNYKSLADEYNIPLETLKYRLKAGWSVEEAVTKPIKYTKRSEKFK